MGKNLYRRKLLVGPRGSVLGHLSVLNCINEHVNSSDLLVRTRSAHACPHASPSSGE